MLFRRHLAGHENTEVADGGMQRIDDRLSPGDDLVDVVVEVENPVERLLGRSDVITPGAEHDDWRFDVAQIDALAPRRANLPLDSLLPTNRLSAIHCISPAFNRTGLPHQVSKSRNRSGSVSTFE